MALLTSKWKRERERGVRWVDQWKYGVGDRAFNG